MSRQNNGCDSIVATMVFLANSSYSLLYEVYNCISHTRLYALHMLGKFAFYLLINANISFLPRFHDTSEGKTIFLYVLCWKTSIRLQLKFRICNFMTLKLVLEKFVLSKDYLENLKYCKLNWKISSQGNRVESVGPLEKNYYF